MADTRIIGPEQYLLISDNRGQTEYELYPTLAKAVEVAADMTAGEYGERIQYHECWIADRFGCPRRRVEDFDARVKGCMADAAPGDHPGYPDRPVVL